MITDSFNVVFNNAASLVGSVRLSRMISWRGFMMRYFLIYMLLALLCISRFIDL